MIYFTDCNAKLWSINLEGRFPKSRITTSEKNQNDEWVNSDWFGTFMGGAKDKAKKLKGTERIKILKGKVTNPSKKMDDGSYKHYLNVSIFDFEVIGSRSSPIEQEQESVEESEFPF
jgi:hypothetical protein